MSYEYKNTCPMCQATDQDIETVKKIKDKKISFLDDPIQHKYFCKKCGYEF